MSVFGCWIATIELRSLGPEKKNNTTCDEHTGWNANSLATSGFKTTKKQPTNPTQPNPSKQASKQTTHRWVVSNHQSTYTKKEVNTHHHPFNHPPEPNKNPWIHPHQAAESRNPNFQRPPLWSAASLYRCLI